MKRLPQVLAGKFHGGKMRLRADFALAAKAGCASPAVGSQRGSAGP